MQNTSTLSKKFKSAEWKRAKRERHEENVAYRAGLHDEKQGTSNWKNREAIQLKIDEMSKRGKRKK